MKTSRKCEDQDKIIFKCEDPEIPLAGRIPRYYDFVNGLLIYALNLLFDYNEPQGGKVIAAYWQHTCIKYD